MIDLMSAAAGMPCVSFEFEDATLCAVVNGKISRFWPGCAGNL
jgi:hypothetical protein